MIDTRPTSDYFMAAIKQAVEKEIQKAVVDETERAKCELDRRIPEVVAGLAIRVMERIRMESFHNEIGIYIKMEDLRKND